jgi:hypothetical protein
MSTRKSHRTREQLLQERQGLASTSLMLNLENSVLALESAGYTEDMIYGFVNCILKGFITEGLWSPIYLAHAQEILRAQRAGEEPALIVDTKISK